MATTVFTGGGPLSEFLRTIHQQLRSNNIPPDPALLDDVKEIASRTAVSLATGTASNGQSPTTYKATMDSKYVALRAAFNRKLFVDCNLHYFSAEEVRKARESFTQIKADMESVLRYVTDQVQNKLISRRWPTVGDMLIDHRKTFRYSDCNFWFSFLGFLLLLSAGLVMFVISIIDAKCIGN